MLSRRRIRPLTDEQLLDRAHHEFAALPGLALTPRQAQRLWGLDPLRCEALLARLVNRGVLARRRDGTYARASYGPSSASAAEGALQAGSHS